MHSANLCLWDKTFFFLFSKAIITESHSLAMVISSLTIVCAVFMGVKERGRYLVLANFCMGSFGKNEAYSMGEGGKRKHRL